MANTLPDEGEWLLAASPGQPLPPFVKLLVYFDYNYGCVQGINRSRFGWLSKLTPVRSNKFGALFQIGATTGQFDATLEDSGDLTIQFLAPQRSTQIAKAVRLNRDALANERGVAEARRLVAQFAGRTERGAFPVLQRRDPIRQSLVDLGGHARIHEGARDKILADSARLYRGGRPDRRQHIEPG